jgi:hypothetical protein
MKVATLRVSSLRGIPRDWPEVEIGDKGLIVYGPNGVGKSSLVDALEWILTGNSTLFPENRTGVSWQTGASHVQGGPFSICLTIKESNGAKYNLSTDSACPPEAAEWVGIAEGSSFVMRRHMLLRFIDARPQGRYQQIEPFLNLGRAASIEQALKLLLDILQTRCTSAIAELRTREGALRRIFGFDERETLSEAILLTKLNAKLIEARLDP